MIYASLNLQQGIKINLDVPQLFPDTIFDNSLLDQRWNVPKDIFGIQTNNLINKLAFIYIYSEELFLSLMNNLQLLKPLHSQIPFLRQLTYKQLQQVVEMANVFVFHRGTHMVKEGEFIDYLGIILEGNVIESGNSHSKGYVFGLLALAGIQQTHTINVVGQNDGILLAIRLQKILKAMNEQLRKKFINISTKYGMELIKQNSQFGKTLQKQVQLADERLINKYICHQLKEYIYKTLDVKERQKLLNFFPPLKFVQKQKIISKQTPIYLLAVLKGEVITKDGSNKILHPGDVYNIQGFLLGYTTYCNIYCASTEAVCLILIKDQIQNILLWSSFQKLCQVLSNKQISAHNYNIPGIVKQPKINIQWQPFMKNKHNIIQLNRKNKKISNNDNSLKQKNNIIAFQSFYQQMIGGNKLKTQVSKKQQQLSSLKSQIDQIKNQGLEKIAALQKSLQEAHQQIQKITQNYKTLKLNFIQAETKNHLQKVFKQIKALQKTQKTIQTHFEMGTSTLKEVFDEHFKSNKLKALVAKCAYKWLQKTRQAKYNKKI